MRLQVVSFISIIWVISFSCTPKDYFQNNMFRISEDGGQKIIIEDQQSGEHFEFSAEFCVLSRKDDPKIIHRPANISNVPYNVITWLSLPGGESSNLALKKRDITQQGDGFDDRILNTQESNRTADLFKAGDSFFLSPEHIEWTDTALVFHYKPEKTFTLKAWLVLAETGYPNLKFEFVPESDGYYSIGYIGAPVFKVSDVREIWQPMIWQEKRFPDQPYMTLAFRCPLPATLVSAANHTIGVVADPSEYPFDPLPLMENSRFGVALRNMEGNAQPMLFAPVMGGAESLMVAGESFDFGMQLFLKSDDMLTSYKSLAREIYGFSDYRSNGPHQLNRTLDHIVDYGMSYWSYYIDSLKGCAYSTDVPGAVKNVSSLNPLEMALVKDNRDIYEARAYPILEYLISREKFLFSLDKEQKIQHPSRKMDGPAAPISELAAVYSISDKKSDALLILAENEYKRDRIRNLDKRERGNTWQNALALYRATGDNHYLNEAVDGARAYVESRIKRPSEGYDNRDTEFFFWTGFVPDYIGLFQLYEETGDKEFLEAAHSSALRYTQFIWFSPMVPDKEIVVNKEGMAPLYWYLKAKGHLPLEAVEESVPAWRLSAIGLTPESSGTSTGHRAIFMANHAPWMYRIGYNTNDKFLIDIARSAVIGRYSNFPGYHINTARTTVYEKEDYPLQPYKQLSVNSFHFNHIWPHASILMDYLVTDAYVKSEKAIDFPSIFIEGYAYLQSKFYGHKPGTFYGAKAWLWMPGNLIEMSSDEINYVAARGENKLFIAFTNQSKQHLKFSFQLNKDIVGFGSTHEVLLRQNDGKQKKAIMTDGMMNLEIVPEGIISLTIEKIDVPSKFQHMINVESEKKQTGTHFKQLDFGNGRAMILNMGDGLKTAYIYLGDDDEEFSEVLLTYSIDKGEVRSLLDIHYPYEFTINLSDQSVLDFSLVGVKPGGKRVQSEGVSLGP